MKKVLFYLTLIIFFVSDILSQSSVPDMVRRSEANPDYHKQRREWLETMHRTEPGVDWKIIEREVREYNRIETNKLREDLAIKDPNLLMHTVAANGNVIGTWKERGSNNQSGRMHCADVDFERGFIYAGSSGGNVWRGTLDGENWICINNSYQFNIRDLRILKIGETNRIVVFDQRSVYYSDDEGFTWNRTTGLQTVESSGYIIRGIAVKSVTSQTSGIDESNNVVYVLANEFSGGQKTNIYYSTDNAQSFKSFRVHNRIESIDIWGSDVDDSNLYLFHRDTVFAINAVAESEQITIKSFFPNYDLLDNPRYYAKGSTNNGITTLYLAFKIGDEQARYIAKSPDGGVTWDDSGVVQTDMFMWNSFCVSRLDPNLLILGGVECFKSTSGGNTWNKINSWEEYYGDPLNKLHADIPGIHSFISPAGEEIFFISTDGGLYRTYGDYDNIKNISLYNLNVSQYYSIYTYNTPNHIIYAGSQDQGFQRSSSGNIETILAFDQIISGDYGSITSGDYGKSLWTVYPGFAMFYPDATKSIQNYMWNFPASGGNRVWMPPIVALPGFPNLAYIAPGGSGNFSTIWRLEYIPGSGIYAGELPFRFDQTISQNDVSALAISELNIDYFYAVTKLGKFYASTDRGVSWTETMEYTGPGYNYLHGTKILTSKVTLGTVYLSGSGYSSSPVYVSHDNGKTFSAINNGMPPTMVYDMAASADEEVLFAATSSGPYIYIKNHNKWYSLNGLENPDQNYWSVNYLDDKKIARFATYGRGIWDFEISHLSTTSIHNIANEVEKSLYVFPNPAIDNIKIEFNTIPHKRTIIKLYDLDGKIHGVLYDNISLDEKISITSNLSNMPGNQILSGNYLIVATSGNKTEYFKLSVVR